MLSVHSCPVGTPGARDTGGMNVYILELARELGRQGHQVDVYTRVHDPADPIIVELGPGARLIHIPAGEGMWVHKLAVYPLLPDFCCNLEAYRKEHDLEYDILFSHYWLSAWAGEYIHQWWRVPHFTMFHTLGATKNATGIGEDESDLRIETEKEMAVKCRHFIVSTEREKDVLVNDYGSSSGGIAVIPCGVNLSLFNPVDREKARNELGYGKEKVLVYVGRIEPQKGLDQLVKAFPLIRSDRPVRLQIIGGDESSRSEVDRLKILAGELGIGESVEFLGTVKHERLPAYYSAADCSVIPSYYESFGLVALESLACGTPVVATDVGDLRNIIRVGETGYIASTNEPHLLAEKIDLALSKPVPDEAYRRLVSDSVIRFGWDVIAGRIGDTFSEILCKRCVGAP